MTLVAFLNFLSMANLFSVPLYFQGSLVCYRRWQYETVPGCSGSGVERKDYCADRPANYLFYVGDGNGDGGLKHCEGDCDSDADCEDSLVCFNRRKYTPVPGCDGTGRKGSDYCIFP